MNDMQRLDPFPLDPPLNNFRKGIPLPLRECEVCENYFRHVIGSDRICPECEDAGYFICEDCEEVTHQDTNTMTKYGLAHEHGLCQDCFEDQGGAI